MGMDFRGDPSSALLEVLDPEQNATFNDHYLEVDYDLSGVMFVTTANTLNIPPPLMDRMEIIRIAGYTEDEKLEIAKRHLLTNSMAKHGLDASESRSRMAGSCSSSVAIRAKPACAISTRNLQPRTQGGEGDPDEQDQEDRRHRGERRRFLGPPKFRYGEIEADDQVGLVTGLAWTEVGGDC